MTSKCVLEKWLDTPNKELFNKRPRFLLLSEEGRALLSQLVLKLESKNER